MNIKRFLIRTENGKQYFLQLQKMKLSTKGSGCTRSIPYGTTIILLQLLPVKSYIEKCPIFMSLKFFIRMEL